MLCLFFCLPPSKMLLVTLVVWITCSMFDWLSSQQEIFYLYPRMHVLGRLYGIWIPPWPTWLLLILSKHMTSIVTNVQQRCWIHTVYRKHCFEALLQERTKLIWVKDISVKCFNVLLLISAKNMIFNNYICLERVHKNLNYLY